MRLFLSIGLLLLGACAPNARTPDQPVENYSEAELASVGGSPSLFGQWEVISIDGRKPEYNQMFLLFGDDWWHVQSQCVWTDGDYRTVDDKLDFSPIKRTFADYEPELRPARVMCARGRSEAERRVPRILAGKRPFTLEDNTLTIRSDEGNLIARSLEEAIANPQGYTDFDAATTWGAWNVISIEDRPLNDAEMVLTFDRITIRLGCGYYQWLRPKNDSGMYAPLVRRKPFVSGCNREITSEEAELLQAIDNIEFSTSTGKDGRIMQAGGKAIRLTR